jgi:hypothetical protein
MVVFIEFLFESPINKYKKNIAPKINILVVNNFDRIIMIF